MLHQIPLALAFDNGQVRRPLMGFRSWDYVGIKVTGAEMNATIDALAEKREIPGELEPVSLADLGYRDVAIDDGWQPVNECHQVPGAIHRGFHRPDGSPIVDETRFPGGIEAMAHRAKKHNLSFSWYTNNCGCSESGYSDPKEIEAHYEGDVHAMINWGVRGLKVDGCSQFNNMTKVRTNVVVWVVVMQQYSSVPGSLCL